MQARQMPLLVLPLSPEAAGLLEGLQIGTGPSKSIVFCAATDCGTLCTLSCPVCVIFVTGHRQCRT